MLRVTHVVPDLHGGGLESLVATLAQRFQGTDVRMSVITLSGRTGRLGEAVRPMLEQLDAIRPVRGVSLIAPLGLARRIRRSNARVVHLHSGVWLKAAWAARLAGVREVIYTEHGREHDDPWLARWLDRRAAQLTSRVVAVSERLRTYLSGVVGIPSGRLQTIGNGVDLRHYSPKAVSSEVRAALGIPAGARVIGSMGRLEPVKNYGQLLAAFADAHARRRGAAPLYLVICGEGSERSALESQAERLGVADVVRLPGWVDEPARFYRLFDVFALTSVSEGVPLSLLEAMACGAVPLVTDVGANAEILGPALASHVVPPRDPDVFRHALAALLQSPERFGHLGKLARERISEGYDLDRTVAAYERLYRSGSDHGRAPAPTG